MLFLYFYFLFIYLFIYCFLWQALRFLLVTIPSSLYISHGRKCHEVHEVSRGADLGCFLNKFDLIKYPYLLHILVKTNMALRKHAYSNILKILPPKKENFQIKNSDIVYISAQNIDCGYSLETPRRGGSNGYPQSMFLNRNKKNNVYPCKPQFYYIEVGFKGDKIYRHVFVMGKLWRSRSNAAERGIWSGSPLFATHSAILNAFIVSKTNLLKKCIKCKE